LVSLAVAGSVAKAQVKPEPQNRADSPEVLKFADRHPIDASPDGRWIAAALVRASRAAAMAKVSGYFSKSGVPRNAFGAEIWIVDARKGESTKLSGERETAWAPAWSPDGKLLAFFSDRDGLARLWIWDRENQVFHRGSSTQAIVRPSDLGFQTPRWSRNGRSLLVKLLPEGMRLEEAAAALPRGIPPRDPSAASVSPFGDDPALSAVDPSWTNLYLADLAVVDLTTGLVGRVGRRAKTLGYAFSPDGRRVLFTELQWLQDGPRARGVATYTLVVADRRAGTHQVVLARGALRDLGLGASWDPFGRRIAYVDSVGAAVVVGATELEVPPRLWKEMVRFGRDGLNFRTDYWPPLWSDDGQRLYLTAYDTLWEATLNTRQLRPVGSVPGQQLLGVVADAEHGRMWTTPDRSGVYVLSRERGTRRMAFFLVSLRDGHVEPRLQTDGHLSTDLPYSFDLSVNGTVAFVGEDAAHWPEVWVSEDTLRTARLASSLRVVLPKKRTDER